VQPVAKGWNILHPARRADNLADERRRAPSLCAMPQAAQCRRRCIGRDATSRSRFARLMPPPKGWRCL